MNAPIDGFTLDVMAAIDAEHALLGGLMLDNGLWDHVGDILQPEDFFTEDGKRIYAAIMELVMASKQADLITVHEKVSDQVSIKRLGEISQFVPSLSNMRRYAEIIRSRSLGRKLMGVGDNINTLAQDTNRPIEDRIEEASGQLMKLLEGGPARDDWQDPDAGMVEFADGLQRRMGGEQNFVPTGLTDLDNRLDGGTREGEVIVIAARPSMGKTALATCIGEHQAKLGHSVGILSMEMLKGQVQTRRVAMESKIHLSKLKRPERMSDFEWSRVTATMDVLRKRPLFISDQTALTLHQVRTKARALKRRRGLRTLLIDYIGLMEVSDKKANRATGLGEISRGLKSLAKELGITILLLVQLNREVEKRPGMRPMMSDLRECGDIEQDADIVIFVHRAIQAKPDLGDEWKRHAELIIGKNRDGQTGIVETQYIGENVQFLDWPADMPKPQSNVRTRNQADL